MLERCMELEPGHRNSHYFNRCLRVLGMPLVWGSEPWNECRARGLLTLIKKMLWAIKVSTEIEVPCLNDKNCEYGPVYLAIAIGEAFDKCNKRGGTCYGTSWEELEGIIEYHPLVAKLFRLFRQQRFFADYGIFKNRAMGILMAQRAQADVLSFGPYGFHNEPFSVPSLVFPTGLLRVTSLMLEREFFATSSVMLAVFPWSLQNDVELGAAFLRDAIFRLQVKYVVPGDSIAVQMIAKAAVKLYELEQISVADVFVLQALERSMTWPPKYPPPTLSKLIPNHEFFAPIEEIVCENDGTGMIAPDMVKVAEIYDKVFKNETVFLKKEYSEAGRGVKKVDSLQDLNSAFEYLFPRIDGIGLVDLDIKIRIFLQAKVSFAITEGPRGFRFYAEGGIVYGAHVSRVIASTRLYGIIYETVRDRKVEVASFQFLRSINYTGFGALWWWKDAEKGKPYLIDFNPRMERHACLSAIFPKLGEPCTTFQLMKGGKHFSGGFITPAGLTVCFFLYILTNFYQNFFGIRYMEPMRVVNMGFNPEYSYFVDLLRQETEYPWNLQKGDEKLYAIHRLEVDNFVRLFDEMLAQKNQQQKV